MAALHGALPLDLPDEDRTTSPGTGLTRAHWVATADALLRGVAPYRSASGAHLDLPGSPARAGYRSDGLEGFARTFLLAAFRSAGDDGTGDDPRTHLDAYARGLVAGTRRERPVDPWQPVGDVGPGGQPMVEAASVALGLRLTGRHTWDTLDDTEQDDVEAWLRGVFRHEPAPNNWYLFPLTVAGFLESVGRGDAETRAATARAVDLLESWYHGDGWYSDGDGRAFDHYIGWALHFYPLLFLHAGGRSGLDDDLAEACRRRWEARLRAFTASYARTFDDDGAPLYQGRSLTYRFATVAPLALASWTGATELEPGRARRIASGALRYFLERGALDDGVLTRGWHGPHGATLQPYSGPASPYWASKAFVALLMPADHPFWRDREVEAPAEDASCAVPSVGWLVHRTADGHVRVHNHGSDHLTDGDGEMGAPDPLYARLAYSTRTGPTAVRNVSDNDVQIVLRGVPSARLRILPQGTGDDWAASSHVPRFPVPVPTGGGAPGRPPVLPAARIDSLVVVRGSWEVRAHRFAGVPDGLDVRASGWALAAADPTGIVEERHGGGGGGGGPAVALVAAGRRSELVGLSGWSAAATARAPQGTAFGRFAVVPELRGTSAATWFVAAVRLGAAAGRAGEPAPRVEVEGAVLRLEWPDARHEIEWTGSCPRVVRHARASVGESA